MDTIVRNVQPIAFENAVWAYTLGAAIALKKGCKRLLTHAEAIGIGLQAFCIPGSVADQRSVGLGHGNLGRYAAPRGDRLLLLPGGPRILRGGGRRYRHRQDSRQGPQKAPAASS